MADYKVSIIVPIYNTADNLARCIDSLLGQTLMDIEIILVNDGSTDHSLEICRAYAARDTRIVIVDKANNGVAEARNSGLDLARGEYIGFVDSDDYIDENMFWALYEVSREQDADIAECGYYRVLDGAERCYPMQEETIEGPYECSFGYITQDNTKNFCCNKLYRASLFDSIRFPKLRYSEDFMINVYTHEICARKTVISDCLYYYVDHLASAVRQDFSLARLDVLKAGEMALDFYKKKHNGRLEPYAVIFLMNNTRLLYELVFTSAQKDKELMASLVSRFHGYYQMVRSDFNPLMKDYPNGRALRWATRLFRWNPPLYGYVQSFRKRHGYL